MKSDIIFSEKCPKVFGKMSKQIRKMFKQFPDTSKPSYKPTGRPAGWHFMNEYVDKWGNVFHKGVEQPKLKGTRPITLSKKKKKILRRTKQEILIAREAEKKAALKKAHQKQKDFFGE